MQLRQREPIISSLTFRNVLTALLLALAFAVIGSELSWMFDHPSYQHTFAIGGGVVAGWWLVGPRRFRWR